MAEWKDLSGLPPAANTEGRPPLAEPVVGRLLAQAWAEEAMSAEVRPLEPGAPALFYTMAGKCARAVSYDIAVRTVLRDLPESVPRWAEFDQAGTVIAESATREGLGIPSHEIQFEGQVRPHPAYVRIYDEVQAAIGKTNLPDEASHWNFGLGNVVHDKLQSQVERVFPSAHREVHSEIPDIDCHGYADIVLDFEYSGDDTVTEVVEIKTQGGYGFKMMIGARGPAEGPKLAAELQGCLNGHALGADRLRLIYLAKENLSDRELAKVGTETWQKFLAEWVVEGDEMHAKATREAARLGKIREFTARGLAAPRQPPDPKIPARARVVDPSTGAWQLVEGGQIMEAGTYWGCNYCDWQDRCLMDGADEQGCAPLPEVKVEIGAKP